MILCLRLVLVMLLLVSFPLLDHWAQQAAADAFYSIASRPTNRPEKPIIVFASHGALSSHVAAAMRRGCVELLTQSSDTLYVLVRQKSYPTVYLAAIPTRSISGWITPQDLYTGNPYDIDCIAN